MVFRGDGEGERVRRTVNRRLWLIRRERVAAAGGETSRPRAISLDTQVELQRAFDTGTSAESYDTGRQVERVLCKLISGRERFRRASPPEGCGEKILYHTPDTSYVTIP